MSGAKHYNSKDTLEYEGKRPVIVVDASGLVIGRMATFVAKQAIEAA